MERPDPRLGAVILANAQRMRITAPDGEPLELLVSRLVATLAIGAALHSTSSRRPAA